jgi:hypothetical protein
VTPFDYITDVLLIAVVVLQMRTRTLTLRSLLLPIGLVAGAGIRLSAPDLTRRQQPRSDCGPAGGRRLARNSQRPRDERLASR